MSRIMVVFSQSGPSYPSKQLSFLIFFTLKHYLLFLFLFSGSKEDGGDILHPPVGAFLAEARSLHEQVRNFFLIFSYLIFFCSDLKGKSNEIFDCQFFA